MDVPMMMMKVHQVFVLSDADYEKRPVSVRNFLRTLRKEKPQLFKKSSLAEESNNNSNKILLHNEKKTTKQHSIDEVSNRIKINQRCKVEPGDRRGEVGFVGFRQTTDGVWIGIRLDEPMGNTDGTDGDKTLFECCGPRYGLWADPDEVEVGDFPPIDPFEMEEI